MSSLRDMAARLCQDPPPGMQLWPTSSGLKATFHATGRRQDIRLQTEGEQLVLTSTVLPRDLVTRSDRRWRELALQVWERNRHTDVALFRFDRDDNLVGRAVHPQGTLDLAEFRLDVHALLVECDRFEYVLTGDDRS